MKFNLYPQIKFMHKTDRKFDITDKEGPDEGLSSFYPKIMCDELCRTECCVQSLEEGRRILERIRGLSGVPPDM